VKFERVVSGICRFLWRKCWQEPEQAKGAIWTVAFWVFVACFVLLASRQLLAALLMVAAFLVMRWRSKPKRLGRPLPYRRRR
jgi:hypothetical protein